MDYHNTYTWRENVDTDKRGKGTLLDTEMRFTRRIPPSLWRHIRNRRIVNKATSIVSIDMQKTFDTASYDSVILARYRYYRPGFIVCSSISYICLQNDCKISIYFHELPVVHVVFYLTLASNQHYM